MMFLQKIQGIGNLRNCLTAQQCNKKTIRVLKGVIITSIFIDNLTFAVNLNETNKRVNMLQLQVGTNVKKHG